MVDDEDVIFVAGIPPLEAIRKQSQYSMPMNGLTAAMKQEDYPNFAPSFCGAEQGMLCIAPDGLLYSCWDLVAMEEEAVGFTDEEAGRFFFNFSKAKWRTRTADLMKPCQTCPYIFICGAAARRRPSGTTAATSARTAASRRRFSPSSPPASSGRSGKRQRR